ncbi:MAG: TonB-dependent receptor plug domain-containing protein [Bacteroidota bacterium]
MKTRTLIGVALLMLLFAGCVANQRPTGSSLVNDPKNNSISSEEVKNPVDLSVYLQRISGVSVRGSGPSAQIRIRGPISFSSGQDPLFVINGAKRGFSYRSIYNEINVRDISTVRVLKNASETARYGTQGAAGVIEITLKK